MATLINSDFIIQNITGTPCCAAPVQLFGCSHASRSVLHVRKLGQRNAATEVLNMCCKFASREPTSAKIIWAGWDKVISNQIRCAIMSQYVPVTSHQSVKSVYLWLPPLLISLLCFPHIHSAGAIRPYNHYPLSVRFSNSRGGTTLQSTHILTHLLYCTDNSKTVGNGNSVSPWLTALGRADGPGGLTQLNTHPTTTQNPVLKFNTLKFL